MKDSGVNGFVCSSTPFEILMIELLRTSLIGQRIKAKITMLNAEVVHRMTGFIFFYSSEKGWNYKTDDQVNEKIYEKEEDAMALFSNRISVYKQICWNCL